MRKNMLAVIILAATLVNITLSAVTLFAIVPKAQRTDELIRKITSAIDLELETPLEGEYGEVQFADTTTHAIEGQQTINLKKGADGKTHFALVRITLTLNTKAEDYETISTMLASSETRIIEIIEEEFAKYTYEEIGDYKEEIKTNALEKIQNLLGSRSVIGVVLNTTVN